MKKSGLLQPSLLPRTMRPPPNKRRNGTGSSVPSPAPVTKAQIPHGARIRFKWLITSGTYVWFSAVPFALGLTAEMSRAGWQ